MFYKGKAFEAYEEIRKNIESKHSGNIGDDIQIECKMVGVEVKRGWTYKFITSDGNIISIRCMSAVMDMRDEDFVFEAEISNHIEVNGEKQTRLRMWNRIRK